MKHNPINIEKKITKIIGHSENCSAETGYEDDCNCYIKDLIKLFNEALSTKEKEVRQGIFNLIDPKKIKEQFPYWDKIDDYLEGLKS